MGAMIVVVKLLLQIALLTAMDEVRVAWGAVKVPAAGCQEQCGNVTTIPFPFGIGEKCSFSDEFNLSCNSSNGPSLYNNDNNEVVDIKLFPAVVEIKLDTTSFSCGALPAAPPVTTTSSPHWWIDPTTKRFFTFSNTENLFVTVGCNTTALVKGSKGETFGCTSQCSALTDSKEPESCTSTDGCCKITIPGWFKNYNSTEFQRNDSSYSCIHTFMVKNGNYTFNSSSDLNLTEEHVREFPIVFDWIIGKNNNCLGACVSDNSGCVESINGESYVCNCSPGYRGNPYLRSHKGCQDINECEDEDPNYKDLCKGSGRCKNKPGSYECVSLPRALIPVVVLSAFAAIASFVVVFLLIQKRKFTMLKKRYFLQNGGSILQSKILGQEIDRSFKIYSREEMKKATNNFDEGLILGRGGQGVVYRGTVPNNTETVAIKKSIVVDGTQVEQFANEIAILSQIIHKNVVKLLGCCLEVENPLLVYEFIPNGTLLERIHGDLILPWNIRLRIAAETSGAVAYLHSSVSVPIIHRDIKSSNILLDLDYTAKVSDFGASRLIPTNELEVTTLIRGTLGYLDPEYLQTEHLTDKSDVYSFGVVLVELLTGKHVNSFRRNEEDKGLALIFIKCMNEGRLEEILDARITNTSVIPQMKEVATIAKRCLSLSGEDRPSMVEVAMQLEGLRRSARDNNTWISHDEEEIQYRFGESDSTATFDEISTTQDRRL